MSDSKRKDSEEARTNEAPESLNQVRDILFGAQMRTVDRHLGQIEKRFQRDSEETRRELTKQLENLEAWSRKQVESLDGKIKAERAKRGDDLKALRSDLRSGLKDLDKRLAGLDDATSTADAETRDHILQLTKTLSADINSLAERFSTDLDRAVSELRAEKTDTASLVELFSDVASRLGKSLEASTSD